MILSDVLRPRLVANSRSDRSTKPPPLFDALWRRLAVGWTWGRLTLNLPGGSQRVLTGSQTGLSAELTVSDYRFAAHVLTSGDIGLAEGYLAGDWHTPDLAVLLETLVNNHDHMRRLHDGGVMSQAVNWLEHQLNRNSRRGARRNIHAHYDLGNAFYEAWLDPSMTYSSARFEPSGPSLEEAQRAKYCALADMMQLQPDHTVLEIGCGWGGFAEFAAGEVGARVTGITISREQYEFARRRVFAAGLAERVDIRLIDYRDVEGQFDRVASIEMFEAVGRAYWPAFFRKLHNVLKPAGRAGLQIITIQNDLFDDYAARTDFIQKYIFPGGFLPSESKLSPVIAQAGLCWETVERFGGDYAETLAQWARRFEAAWEDVRAQDARFDERFRRLWGFYLAYCEAGFRSARTDVIQLSLSRAA